MDKLLSQREFDTWRESDAEFKNRVLGHIETQTVDNLRTENRLSTLESDKEHSLRQHGWVNNMVAAVIGAIVGGLSGKVF